MTTFHQWLTDQGGRGDHVGHLARLWRSYEHPRLSGLAGVTKSLRERAMAVAANPAGYHIQGLPSGAEWIEPAIAAATAEYRNDKAPSPELVAANADRLSEIGERLARIEANQHLIMRAVGIPLAEVNESARPWETHAYRPQSITEQAGFSTELASQVAEAAEQQLAEVDAAGGWEAWYELADHQALESDGA